MMRSMWLAIGLAIAGCGPGIAGGPTMTNKIDNDPQPVAVTSPVVSADILAREPLANVATVKHILVGWKDLADAYQGHQDARGAARSKADAEKLVTEIVGKLAAGGDFDALMKEHSEDSGSAQSGRPFKVSPDAQLVLEFRQLSLRLKPTEVGVCQSDYGFHIIKRYE